MAGSRTQLLLGTGLLTFLAFKSGCQTNISEKQQEEKAIEEVTSRTSLNASLATSADKYSERYYTSLCIPHPGRDWPHRTGVTRAIDLLRDKRERVRFEYCVNTETWEIQPDDDFTAKNSTDDTKLLNAMHFCAQLTDRANALRKTKIGGTSLVMDVSGTDTSANDFSCTSTFPISSKLEAVWVLYPNRSPATDRPINYYAEIIQTEIDQEH